MYMQTYYVYARLQEVYREKKSLVIINIAIEQFYFRYLREIDDLTIFNMGILLLSHNIKNVITY